MLKLLSGIVLGLVILMTSAYAAPAYAASAPVVITHVQAGGVGAPLQELVAIYNNTLEEIDITHWCLKNKSTVSFACFEYPGSTDFMILKPHGYATAATSAMTTYMDMDATIVYTPTNQSSGSIVGSNDAITLYDSTGTMVDSLSWTTGLASGTAWVRGMRFDEISTYLDTDQLSDWHLEELLVLPRQWLERREGPSDSCPNLAGFQEDVPPDYTLNENGECVAPFRQLDITELLPNAAGSDEGKEFIEIYNPNDEAVTLTNYVLWIGLNFEKTYTFVDGQSIAPNAYLVIDNATIPYSLANTSSRVRLTTLDGQVVSESAVYENPKDNVAWALIADQWQYTNQPSAGADNILSVEKEKSESKRPTPKPCRPDQYRSPETNRCRLIATKSTSPTPCKPNQYRSPETNRCRNLTSADTGPTPCKEGQERNPETHRCRTLKQLATADYGVLGTETVNGGINWYVWATIGGILVLALAYAIWEWHDEIQKTFTRLWRFARVRK